MAQTPLQASQSSQSRERNSIVEIAPNSNSMMPAVMEAVGERCCQSPKEDLNVWWGCRSAEKLQRGNNGLAGLKETQKGRG